jgi:hypothetical protein
MLVPVQECILPDGTSGRISVGTYPNGRIAIVLECQGEYADHWEQYTILTCNLPAEHLGSDELCIKNWSENEGFDTWAVEQDIIMPKPNRHLSSGFVLVPVYSMQLVFYKRAFNAALDAAAKPREGVSNG